MKTLTEMLTERDAIAQLTETILDESTEHWGVKVRTTYGITWEQEAFTKLEYYPQWLTEFRLVAFRWTEWR